MLGVDHDKNILLSTPFQPSQCWEQIVGVMLLCSMLEINDVVLYCCIITGEEYRVTAVSPA